MTDLASMLDEIEMRGKVQCTWKDFFQVGMRGISRHLCLPQVQTPAQAIDMGVDGKGRHFQ